MKYETAKEKAVRKYSVQNTGSKLKIIFAENLKNITRDHTGQATGSPEGVGDSPQGVKRHFLLHGRSVA